MSLGSEIPVFDYPNKKGIFITVKSGWLDIEFVRVFNSRFQMITTENYLVTLLRINKFSVHIGLAS